MSLEPSVENTPDLGTVLQERLSAGDIEMPLLPNVAFQALELSRSKSASAARLSALIHTDQAIAGHLLRVANSPIFAGRVRIVSLQQAIARLGNNNLAEIIISVAIRGRVFRAKGFESLTQQMWRHSLCTGLFAKEIARIKRRNVESAFLCGLLHDIGKPVLLLTMSDIATELKIPLELRTILYLFQKHYQVIGMQLAESWKLPEPVLFSIAHHHHPEKAQNHRDFVWVTALASALAGWVGGTIGAEQVSVHPACTYLNLYPDDMDVLMEKHDTIVETMEAM